MNQIFNSLLSVTAFQVLLIAVGPGVVFAQPLNIAGSAQPTTNQTIYKFKELPFVDVLPDFNSQVQFSLPENFEFANASYDTAFFAIDPLGFGFPVNFFATQFGILNVSFSRNSVRELKIYESDTLTSVFIRGLKYNYFSCQNTMFNTDSAAVRIDLFPDKITIYMSGIPTTSCPEFRINEGLPGRRDYQSLSWFIIRVEGGNSYRSGFTTESNFNGQIDQLNFLPGNNRGPFPYLRGGFPEVPLRIDIISDSTSSTIENPTTLDKSEGFRLSNGEITFEDKPGSKLKLTVLNSIGQILVRDVFEINVQEINSSPIIVQCATIDGIRSKMYYIAD